MTTSLGLLTVIILKLRLAEWNINGLSSSINELEALIVSNNLDIVLISESHATRRSSIRLKGFQIYCTPTLMAELMLDLHQWSNQT